MNASECQVQGRCCLALLLVADVLATIARVFLLAASRSAWTLAEQCRGRRYQYEDPRADARSLLQSGQLRACFEGSPGASPGPGALC
jgi:hypothetical protein